jgi:hypothetical protein
MEYTNNVHIYNRQDVETFAKYLVYDCKISCHPDDDFTDYFNTKEQVDLYNHLNNECFVLCEKEGLDLYDIHYQVQYNFMLKNSD